ncbi:unnamed protein product [Effrenium voratum]|nr:unnamed protein product [Effrenium voratum]
MDNEHVPLEDAQLRLRPRAGWWHCLRRSPRGVRAADDAVRQLFEGLAQEAEEKRQQRLLLGLKATGARGNREALYLSPERREPLERSLRSFLAEVEGDAQHLQRLAALQHFLEVDIADLHLPPERRCSEDEFLEEPGMRDVCGQFLMDVTRGVYLLDGRRFDFQETLAKSGLDLEQQSLEVERLKETFATEVASLLRRHLAESGPGRLAERRAGCNVLVRGASSLLTQSGLAHLERACGSVVVSGGDQELLFELRPADAGFDLCVASEKSGFGSFVLNSSVRRCSEASKVSRSAVIRLTVRDASPPLSAEVLELRSEVELLDEQTERPMALEERKRDMLRGMLSSLDFRLLSTGFC